MPLDPKDTHHHPPDRVARAEALARLAPVPARVGRILVGSASWTDPTLVRSGLFYPANARTPESRLRYYAQHFPMVEVDASYYALPTQAQARLWVDRTPPDFVFDIKAFSALTGHSVELKSLPRDLRDGLPAALARRTRARTEDLPAELVEACWSRFVDALGPLRVAGKLGAILLQYPPWFDATRGHARRIEEARSRLPDLPIAVEFRHRSWVEPARIERVLTLFRELEIAWVAVDSPQCGDTALPPVPRVAWDGLALVRFHGRNAATWDAGALTAAERFDWLYDTAELAPWVEPIQQLADEAQAVHVVMNNCTYNAAQLGGKGLAALLSAADGGDRGGAE